MFSKDSVFSSLILVSLLAVAVFYGLAISVPAESLRPGSFLLHLAAVTGSVLMGLAAVYCLVRRLNVLTERKSWWSDIHMVLGTTAISLVFLHSSARLTKTPALILAAAFGVLLSGAFGRLIAARWAALNFGGSLAPFASPSPEPCPAIEGVIDQKVILLSRLSPQAKEAEFSLGPVLWFRHPLRALRYQQLCWREGRLVRSVVPASTNSLSPWERYWRTVHLVTVALLFVGLGAHLVTTLFFANYASGGEPVYWWHFRR